MIEQGYHREFGKDEKTPKDMILQQLSGIYFLVTNCKTEEAKVSLLSLRTYVENQNENILCSDTKANS
jgi:hypothetical protein